MSTVTCKAKLHYYRFNVFVPEDRAAYAAMVERIKSNQPEVRGRWMHAIASPAERSKRLMGNSTVEVDVELSHIFENQWNTTDGADGGLRVFDWYEEYPTGGMNKDIKTGHWLELTRELAAARRDTLKCQYCGCQYGPYHRAIPEKLFCMSCLDSPYLNKEELYLTRLKPLAAPDFKCQPLTEEESAWLVPLYVDRQAVGKSSRSVKARAAELERIETKYKKDMIVAETEYRGFKWLHDHHLSLGNVIYYSHTDTFCFGWRSPLSADVVQQILKHMSEFPFKYELKCADGKTLENYVDG